MIDTCAIHDKKHTVDSVLFVYKRVRSIKNNK